jgi:transcriptional regulator with XRE-family HTH domain
MLSCMASLQQSGPSTTALQRLREGQGLTREALAARAGLSARSIYGHELEGVRPQRATAYLLALALGVDPGALEDR